MKLKNKVLVGASVATTLVVPAALVAANSEETKAKSLAQIFAEVEAEATTNTAGEGNGAETETAPEQPATPAQPEAKSVATASSPEEAKAQAKSYIAELSISEELKTYTNQKIDAATTVDEVETQLQDVQELAVKITSLMAFQYLTATQKTVYSNDLVEKYKSDSSDKSTEYTTVFEAAEESDTLMRNVDTLLTNADALKQNRNLVYALANESNETLKKVQDLKASKEALDTKVTEVNSLKSDTNLDTVKASLQELETKKDALAEAEKDTDAKIKAVVSETKTELKNFVEGTSHISESLKTKTKDKADKTNWLSSLVELKNTIVALEEDTPVAVAEVNKQDAVHGETKYLNAEDDKKQAYDNAVKAIKDLLEGDKLNSETTTAPQLKKLTEDLKAAEAALNGEGRLKEVQDTAKAAIDALPYLSTAIKEHFKAEIDKQTLVAEVERLQKQATDLNASAEELINQVKAAIAVKPTVKYTLASETPDNLKTALDEKQTAGENLLTHTAASGETPESYVLTSKDTEKDAVNTAAKAIKDAIDALDGDKVLAKKREDAKAQINALEFLSDNAKSQYNNKIDTLEVPKAIDGVVTVATTVNAKAGELINEVKKHPNYKEKDGNYIEADQDKKTAFDNAMDAATALLENNLLREWVENLPEADAKLDVETKKDEVVRTYSELNGTERLNKAKEDANTALDGLNYLPEEYKQAKRDEINDASSINAVNAIKDAAKALNASVEALVNALRDAKAYKTNENYTEATPEKQAAFNNAITNGDALLSNEILKDKATTQEAVDAATAEIKRTKAALDGFKKVAMDKLNEYKNARLLVNLSRVAVDEYVKQINDLTNPTKEQVDAIVNEAIEVNKVAGEHIRLLSSATSTIIDKPARYENASKETKANFNNLVEQQLALYNKVKDAARGQNPRTLEAELKAATSLEKITESFNALSQAFNKENLKAAEAKPVVNNKVESNSDNNWKKWLWIPVSLLVVGTVIIAAGLLRVYSKKKASK
ncbi:GA module-containing protein [Mycoplasmopsis gallinacea]|uniref:ECM-binding protein homolog A n=1 Tax=Mycoplasmopsis gallinacea TaxID=29556 RepID=A0A449A2W5_9BACT|nr:GA module-containing protein [Mycoplasmopsis gallinacea]VEU58533.1 ECM-binding protein homolog A [Mycoplasmopsis gallinacea]